MATWINVSLAMEIGLGQGDFVLDGDHVPPSPKGGGAPPQFSPRIYCGQSADLVRMLASAQGTLCYMEMQSSLPNKGGGAPLPIFGPFLLCPNGWMH